MAPRPRAREFATPDTHEHTFDSTADCGRHISIRSINDSILFHRPACLDTRARPPARIFSGLREHAISRHTPACYNKLFVAAAWRGFHNAAGAGAGWLDGWLLMMMLISSPYARDRYKLLDGVGCALARAPRRIGNIHRYADAYVHTVLPYARVHGYVR